MTTTVIREKLYNYIKTTDDEQIKSIYDLFEDQLAPAVDWSEDEAFVKELNERVERFKSGVDRGYSWNEVKAEIQNRKDKRGDK